MKRMMGPGGFGRLRRLGGGGGLALAALCLGACVFGGTGSDHENGVGPTANPKNDEYNVKGVTARVTDEAGSPLAGVTLYLYDPAYRPDLGQARRSQLTDTAPIPVTDSLGYASLDLSAPGKFVVEGVSAGIDPVLRYPGDADPGQGHALHVPDPRFRGVPRQGFPGLGHADRFRFRVHPRHFAHGQAGCGR